MRIAAVSAIGSKGAHPARALLVVLLLLGACGQEPGAAERQPQPLEISGGSGTLIYMPEEFAYFQPETALDMVELVPDFSGRGARLGRGNILINGQRLEGSPASVRARLDALPSALVVRIEILDHGADDLPAAEARVANVVTESGNPVGNHSPRVHAH
ncbi:conserved hypothetical protein [Altererythrobacter sp. B11]|uniref:hypothetical protein n=1 Tax=Altererythrobacter sp. B11 TaxID=2060312 RepID=UPI000DC736DF|nr:hypothetical protein [Altererythrobacter sp. B11]BBC74218.1 conserved hypothetical protein [Altererythrobacter sp. B11]